MKQNVQYRAERILDEAKESLDSTKEKTSREIIKLGETN